MELQKFEATLCDGRKVVTLGIKGEAKDIVMDMLNSYTKEYGSYSLKEDDAELVNVWISDAFSEGETEYAEALQHGLANDAYIYTLVDSGAGFSQEICEVIVY